MKFMKDFKRIDELVNSSHSRMAEISKPVAELHQRMALGSKDFLQTLEALKESRDRWQKLVGGNSFNPRELKTMSEQLRDLSQPIWQVPIQKRSNIERIANRVNEVCDKVASLPETERDEQLHDVQDEAIAMHNDVIATMAEELPGRLESLKAEIIGVRKSQIEETGKLLTAISDLKTISEKAAETAAQQLEIAQNQCELAKNQSASADRKAKWAIIVTFVFSALSLIVAVISCVIAHHDAVRAEEEGLNVASAVTNQTKEVLSGMMGLRKAMRGR